MNRAKTNIWTHMRMIIICSMGKIPFVNCIRKNLPVIVSNIKVKDDEIIIEIVNDIDIRNKYNWSINKIDSDNF